MTESSMAVKTQKAAADGGGETKEQTKPVGGRKDGVLTKVRHRNFFVNFLRRLVFDLVVSF